MWTVDWGAGWWIIMVIMMLVMLAFWGGVIYLIVWGIRKLAERDRAAPGGAEKRNPLEIAKERYARGEISRQEFEQLKKDLS